MNTKTLRFVQTHAAPLSAQIQQDILANWSAISRSCEYMDYYERNLENDLSDECTPELSKTWARRCNEHNDYVIAAKAEIARLEIELEKAVEFDDEFIPQEWEPTLRHGWVAVW